MKNMSKRSIFHGKCHFEKHKIVWKALYFLRNYLAYYVYKPIPLEENLKKPKCSYFALKASRGLVTK